MAVNSARMTMTATPLMPDLVISADCTIEGTVCSHGTVLIHGCVKGHIEAHTVICDITAHVLGHIVCTQLDMAGYLNGSFDAQDVLIRAGAHINTFEEAICAGTCRIAGTFSGELKAREILLEGNGQINRMPAPESRHPTPHIRKTSP